MCAQSYSSNSHIKWEKSESRRLNLKNARSGRFQNQQARHWRTTNLRFEYRQRRCLSEGAASKSEFMRIAFFDTLVVKFSTEDMQELLRLVRSISNNGNQIAVRVNSTDKVYREDMDNIMDGVERIWQQLRYFRSQLQQVKP